MRVRTSAPRGKLRDRIVKGPINGHVVSRGNRPFIRRRLMKEIKAQRRQARLRQTDKTKPAGPRPSRMFRDVWRKMRGLEQEE